MSVLIVGQTDCNVFQQMTKVAANKERVNNINSLPKLDKTTELHCIDC